MHINDLIQIGGHEVAVVQPDRRFHIIAEYPQAFLYLIGGGNVFPNALPNLENRLRITGKGYNTINRIIHGLLLQRSVRLYADCQQQEKHRQNNQERNRIM